MTRLEALPPGRGRKASAFPASPCHLRGTSRRGHTLQQRKSHVAGRGLDSDSSRQNRGRCFHEAHILHTALVCHQSYRTFSFPLNTSRTSCIQWKRESTI